MALDRLLPQKQERSGLDAADAPAGPWMSAGLWRNRRRRRIDEQLPDVAMIGWEAEIGGRLVRVEDHQQRVVHDRPAVLIGLADRASRQAQAHGSHPLGAPFL